ncbi:MAG: penicillin-binding protein 2 [Actinomycetota bacterium]|nr:penicillin-binding protein 2 [Actinomycetota bacterium]
MRAFGLLVIMGVAFVAIVARLTWLQGIGANQYLAVGSSEWTHTVTLAAERGSIVDRSGRELAISIPQTTLYTDPHQVTDPTSEAARLAPALGQAPAMLQTKLTEHNHFTYLARTVDDATAASVKAMNLPGVYSLAEPKRFYPAGQLARPLVGVAGTDGTGLGGLESKYQSILEGRPGKLVEQTDPSGRQIAGGLQQYQAPVAGGDLVLTLDNALQYDAEQALAQAIVAAKARSGVAVLMDRKTGDIVADAQLSMPAPGTSSAPAVPVDIPSPTGTASPAPATGTQPVEAASASSFTQVYEPGSVNKLVTISGALQRGSITPSSTFTIPNTYDVAGTTIHDAESHGTEHWNVTDILTNSSNIGTLQIAQKLGKTGILNTIAGFGEGRKTDINFPGESAGILPSYWSGTTLADVSFGQGVSVTAMQVLAAYNAIANDGEYVAPRLVAGTIDKTGAEHPTPITPGHRVVSPTVAKQMKAMLDEVVRVGTGQAANLNPYTVAGKTGTASIPSPSGGYLAGHYVASFAGFVPAENPSITGMVVINDTPDFGAAASAPTFATLARDALQALKVPPEPKHGPPDGVPLTNTATATAAGESAGTALPGLSATPIVPATGPPPTGGSPAPKPPTTAAK